MAKIFARERRKIEKGEKKPRFRVVAAQGDIKFFASISASVNSKPSPRKSAPKWSICPPIPPESAARRRKLKVVEKREDEDAPRPGIIPPDPLDLGGVLEAREPLAAKRPPSQWEPEEQLSSKTHLCRSLLHHFGPVFGAEARVGRDFGRE